MPNFLTLSVNKMGKNGGYYQINTFKIRECFKNVVTFAVLASFIIVILMVIIIVILMIIIIVILMIIVIIKPLLIVSWLGEKPVGGVAGRAGAAAQASQDHI